MALVIKAFPGSLTVQELEVALGLEEQSLGTLIELEASGGRTSATFDSARRAPPGPLIVRITGPAIDLPPGTKLVLHGQAFLKGAEESVSVFRLASKEDPDEFAWGTDEEEFAPDEAADDYAFITGPEVDTR